jgi:methionine synthase II (cobalamin-independent)
MAMETTPDGWRFAMAPGRQMRRAQSYLGEDLDALEEACLDYAGPVKVQVAGPWTMAASVELHTGERALRDPSAAWDIAQALAEAVRAQVADVKRRLPKASAVIVQLDEPGLPAVLEGRIGTASGLSSYRAVDPQDAERALRHVLSVVSESSDVAGVHCCAVDVPVDLLRTSGAGFVSVDFTVLEDGTSLDESLGQAWEAGVGIFAGCIPSLGQGDVSDRRASAPLRAVLHRLGLEDERWLRQVVVTPSCGLAGASPAWARTALAASRAVGRVVRHDEAEQEGDDA